MIPHHAPLLPSKGVYRLLYDLGNLLGPLLCGLVVDGLNVAWASVGAERLQ